MATKDIEIKIRLNDKEYHAKILDAGNALNDIAGEAQQVNRNVGGWAMSVTGFNQALEASKTVVNTLHSVLASPLQKAAMMESYQAQLKVMLGDTEKAQDRLDELIEFAKSTPFELPGVIELGNKLQSVGKYSEQLMIDLGDLASASQKSTEQVFNAYAKLTTGQIGEAKLMFRDLLISDQDWERALNAKGLTENAENMTSVLGDILIDKGFSGMMEEQSKMMNGMYSNFVDALDQMVTAAGTEILPVAKEIISVLTPAIGAVTENIDEIIPVIKVVAVATAAWAVSTYGAAAALKAKAIAVALAEKATALFNKTLAANPILLIISGVTALTFALNELTSSTRHTVASIKEQVEETREEIKAKRDLLAASQKEIQNKIKEADANEDSAWKVARLRMQYQKLIQTKKELSILEAEQTMKESAALIFENAEGPWSSVGGELVQQKALIELTSGTIKERLAAIDKIMEDSSAKMERRILKYKSALMDWKELKDKGGVIIEEPEEDTGRPLDTGGGGGSGGKKPKTPEENIELEIESITALEEAYSNELITLTELDNKKREFAANEQLRVEEEVLRTQARNATVDNLELMLLEARMQRHSITQQMISAESNAEFVSLQKQREITQKKIDVIEAEAKARQEAAAKSVEASAQQYDAQKSVFNNILSMARQRIKVMLSEAVATQLGKVISTIPFPFNIIAAPAAGVAVSALFDSIVPSFHSGGIFQADEGLAKLQSGEAIINRAATARNAHTIRDMNAGKYAASNSDVVKAIENQTKTLAALDRQVKLSMYELDEAITRFEQQKNRIT